MASIVKRKNRFSVVYTVKDENGVQRQKWETFDTNAAAKKRKTQVEYELQHGSFIVPTARTVSELLEEYMSVYGVSSWAMSTYEARRGLIFNYINPLIGDMKLDDLNPRVMDRFYQSLFKVKSKITQNRKPKNEYLTVHTVREIHKLLRNAFNQAVKWEMLQKNPVLNATLPKEEHAKREIWTVETLHKALELCDDDILSLALNLAFSCSLRMGEMLGLTWDCVDISEESIKTNQASVFVNKELQRVNKDAAKALDGKDIIFTFPHILTNGTTDLVLKTPKTKISVRKIFLPNTVAQILVKRKEQIDELKELFGSDFTDYNLVFSHASGRPMEGANITRSLKKLIRENDLPDVVFHSFRHASITYKLKWNGGDMKSVQGDSGHARVEMVADVYSHILDEDRKLNAQRFDEQFYGAKAVRGTNTPLPMPQFETVSEIPEETPKSQKAKPLAQPNEPKEPDTELVKKLLANPEMMALLQSLAGKI